MPIWSDSLRAGVCVLVMAGLATGAHAADSKNIVRFGVTRISPTGDLTVDGFFVEDIDPDTRLEFSGNLTLEADSAIGVEVTYERRLTPLVGVEVGLLGAHHDVNGRLAGTARIIRNSDNAILDEFSFDETEEIGSIDVVPWTGGVNLHLLRKTSIDLYVGAYLAYVLYGDLDVQGEKVPINDEFTWGAVLGIDVPVGKGKWAFQAALRYLQTQAEPSEGGSDAMALDVDPYILRVGAACRF